MKEQERRRIIGKLMVMTWGSLESHILWPYLEKPKNDEKFNIEVIKDYIEQLKLLSELL